MEEKESTLKNLEIISFLVFIVIGAIYLFSVLMTKSGIARTLQLPFIITTLLHFTIQFIEPLATDAKKHKILISLIIILNILLFLGALYLHFHD